MAAKTDMERIGLFSEPGYHTIGDKYGPHVSHMNFNVASGKGKQMLPGGNKNKCATQAGYFDQTFKRILESEAYSETLKVKRQERLVNNKKHIGKIFVPNPHDKDPNGRGTFYGTFAGPIPALSCVKKTQAPYKSPMRNLTTNPGKKGTGFGYPHLTIGRAYEHKDEKYGRGKELHAQNLKDHKSRLRGSAFVQSSHPTTYFQANPYRTNRPLPKEKEPKKLPTLGTFKPSSPGKHPGGNKSGTFDVYPLHSVDEYRPKGKAKKTPRRDGKLFLPNNYNKTRPQDSVVNQNVKLATNRSNYKSVKKVMAF